MRDDIRARALHLHFTEGIRSAEARTILEREFPDADDDIAKALWYVGFSEWKSGCHGMKWDPNIDRFVQTHRIIANAPTARVRIRPDPIPGHPMDYPEMTPEQYEAQCAAALQMREDWRRFIQSGFPHEVWRYWHSPRYIGCDDNCGAQDYEVR